VSLESGREVEGSVDKGENMSSGAGVLGGSESRIMSVVGTGSGRSIGGGGMFRVMVNLPRLGFGSGFLSGLSATLGRCFLGERIGSVLTGSMGC
jgi:hypothetical protein